MSYRTLAQRAGIALSTLYRVESDEASPTVKMLVKLAKALDVDVVDFFPPKRQRRRPGGRA